MMTRKLGVSARQLEVSLCLAIFTAIAPIATFAQRGATMGHGVGRPHFVMGARAAAMPPIASRSPHLPYQPGASMQRTRGAGRPMGSAFITMNRASHIAANRTFNRRFRRDHFRFAASFGIPPNGFLPLSYGYWPWWGDSFGGTGECDAYNGNCGETPAADADAAEPREEDAQRPMITVYLRDGSGYGALD